MIKPKNFPLVSHYRFSKMEFEAVFAICVNIYTILCVSIAII